MCGRQRKLILVQLTVELFSENERQLGFVLIIDRRSDRWTAVKSLIGYIEVNKCFTDMQHRRERENRSHFSTD